MSKKVNKTLIKQLFGEENSLNIDEIKRQLNFINSIYSKHLNKNSPRLVTNNNKIFNIEEPQDLKKVFSNLQYYLNNCLIWRSTRTQFNVTPPPILPSISSQVLIDMLNPTLVTEIGCGNLLELEKDLTKFISNLVNWNEKKTKKELNKKDERVNSCGCNHN